MNWPSELIRSACRKFLRLRKMGHRERVKTFPQSWVGLPDSTLRPSVDVGVAATE